MDVLILGGENPRHYDWVRQLKAQLEPDFETVVYLDYRHWSRGGTSDIPYEISEAAKLAQTLDTYIVVAKSIGTIITALGAAEGRLDPRRCILLGLPLGAVEHIPGASEALKRLPPTVVMQNDHDPIGSFEAVKAFMSVHGNQQTHVISSTGDTHDYVNFELIRRLALNEDM